jgi:hypothetical protein
VEEGEQNWYFVLNKVTVGKPRGTHWSSSGRRLILKALTSQILRIEKWSTCLSGLCQWQWLIIDIPIFCSSSCQNFQYSISNANQGDDNFLPYSAIFILFTVHRGVNVGGVWGGVVHPPREMIQSVSNYVQSVSKLCVCLHAVLCEAN